MTQQTDRLNTALAGRYRILRHLGEGGMASVYLCEDLKHDRKVALKLLKPELAAVLGAERFVQEIKTTAALQHPHILPLFDSGAADGFLFYVMPFIDGETLRAKLDRETQLGVDDAVRIAREVLDALHYAHEHGIVHRDVKPENILLHGGHAMVADFGIALAVSAAAGGRMTETGLSLGTQHYMSPEQATAEKDISARSDVYSLGSVLYEMLTGQPPHLGGSAQQIIMKIITEPAEVVTKHRKSVPPHVAAAVATSLEKLPADRFESAKAFSEALGNPAYTNATLVGAVSSPTRARRQRATTMAGFLLAALAFAGWMWSEMRPRAADSGEPRFYSITLPDSAPVVSGRDQFDATLRSFDLSADGRLLVYTSPHGSATRLWQLRTDFGTASPIAGTARALLPTLSPDGRALAFVVDTVVRRLTLADGAISRVSTQPWIQNLWWPSAGQLVSDNLFDCLRVVSPNGGAWTQLAPKAPCVPSAGFAVAGGGSGPLVLSIDGVITLQDATTGRMQPVRTAGAKDTTDATTVVTGERPLLIGDRLLLFLRDGALVAARLDVSRARLASEPLSVLAGIQVEPFTGAQLALSSEGTLLWATGADGSVARFVWVGGDGGGRDTLYIPASFVSSFTLSPDGHRLAYSVRLPGRGSVVRVVDLTRRVVDETQFPVEVRVDNWIAGDTALTVMLPQKYGSRSWAVLRIAGPALVLDTSDAQVSGSSPDGRMHCWAGLMWPAAARRDSIRFDVQSTSVNDIRCRFSPDGHHIAWVTSEGLFVAPVEAGAQRARRKLAPAGADEPRWSPDGRVVYYRDANRWFVVAAAPGPGGTVAPPRLRLRGSFNQAFSSWELGPDGRFLLLEGPPPMRATHLNVIANFPRYVEEKLRGAKPE